MTGWASLVSLVTNLLACVGLAFGVWMIWAGAQLGPRTGLGFEAIASGGGMIGGAVFLFGVATIIDLLNDIRRALRAGLGSLLSAERSGLVDADYVDPEMLDGVPTIDKGKWL